MTESVASRSTTGPSSTATADPTNSSTTQSNGLIDSQVPDNGKLEAYQSRGEKRTGVPRGRKKAGLGMVQHKRQMLRKRGPKVKVDPEVLNNGQVRRRRRGRPRTSPKREGENDVNQNMPKKMLPLSDLADPEEIEKILMTPLDQEVEEEDEDEDGVIDEKALVGFEKVRTKPRKERIKKNLKSGHYECPFCSFHSQYYSAVASHTLIHTGEKPYKCRVCDYRARQRGHIVVHMRMHTGSKPFKCPDCDYATIQRSHLRVHMQVHSSERPFQCHTCSYRSKHQSILKVHMKKYGHEKAYSCSECSYTSARKHNLLQHMTLHTGLKPYKCDLCPYESNQKGHLNVHIRTHTREKPFKCDECPFASTVPKSLREHMTMHQGKRPLQCQYCSFSTSQPFSIKNHVALHEDTKQIKCKYCSYSTSIEKDFLTHRSIHIQAASYCCSICTFTTPFKHQFDHHLISHREVDVKDKTTWDRRIKAEKISSSQNRTQTIMRKRLRSTSRKPLQQTSNDSSSSRAKSPAGAQLNGHAEAEKDTLSSSTEDLHTAIVEFNDKEKSPSSEPNPQACVKTEVHSENPTSNSSAPMAAPLVPPKAVSRRQPRVADAESSKLAYKLFKPDIIRRKMLATAKFFCDYCARPFVLHDDWKRHVIRHFMEWPEIEV